MTLAEAGCIREPRDRVAECADRKLDQHVAAGGVIFMMQHEARLGVALFDRPDVDGKAHIPALRGPDQRAFVLALEQDIASVEIAQPGAPGPMLSLRQKHAAAMVEVEEYSLGARLGRPVRRRRIGRLDLRR